jgi:hypothetical protein
LDSGELATLILTGDDDNTYQIEHDSSRLNDSEHSIARLNCSTETQPQSHSSNGPLRAMRKFLASSYYQRLLAHLVTSVSPHWAMWPLDDRVEFESIFPEPASDFAVQWPAKDLNFNSCRSDLRSSDNRF